MTNLGTIQAEVKIDMWYSDTPPEWYTTISKNCYVPEEPLEEPIDRPTVRRHKLANGWKNLRKFLRESRD